MGATVLSVSSRALLDACARLGLDTDRILQAANVARATVLDPDARIPLERVAALWQNAYELSGDPNLALHAIEVLPLGAYRVIDYLIASAPTVGAALASVSAYFPLINNVVRLPYAADDDRVTFGVDAPSLPSVITRQYAEYTLAACFLHTRAATNRSFGLIRVEFCHGRPPDISEHERIFDCPVRFGAGGCRMVIAREVWDMPRDESDPTLFSVLDQHARMLLEKLPTSADTASRVRAAIAAQPRGAKVTLESVAGDLAMTPRTLQRRLKEDGVVFNELLDAVRFGSAKSYLARDDVAVSEVAYLLGFADQSSFNHAFRRWSGVTPTEYRRSVAT